MLNNLPNDDALYQALIDRDDRFDGRAYVGVITTGIFCKLTCTARKPKRENCEFYPQMGAAMAKGFRPCKVCKPLGDRDLAALLADVSAHPERDWREDAIRVYGFDPRTLRRNFEKQYGLSFAEFVRQMRLKKGIREMEQGAKVIDAQLAAGFNSAQGFRDAFALMLGIRPSDFLSGASIKAHWLETPLGDMIAIADDDHLHMLEFVDRKNLAKNLQSFVKKRGLIGLGETKIHTQVKEELAAYFEGKRARFDVPVAFNAEGFTKSVWQALCEIPAGETRSYGALAEHIGNAKAFRAVANANARNQIAIVIPCHRVIGSDGKLAGYAGGVWRKEKLIEIERQYGE